MQFNRLIGELTNIDLLLAKALIYFNKESLFLLPLVYFCVAIKTKKPTLRLRQSVNSAASIEVGLCTGVAENDGLVMSVIFSDSRA